MHVPLVASNNSAQPPPVRAPALLARSPSDEPEIILTWLERLRWLAVAGQLLAAGAAHFVLGLKISLIPIASVIAITFISNVLIALFVRRGWGRSWLVPSVLVLDVCLLTALLYLTGGAQNPFSILYIVHIVLAVVMLGEAWTWLIAAVACISFGFLLFLHRPLIPPEMLSTRIAALGEWLAFTLVAVLIGYFAGRIVDALRLREKELAMTREQAARSEQLASLSTLAAGAAHELGTPLGTIALVAKELELASAGDVKEDARLIRQEVDRCRAILDRMRIDMIEGLRQAVSSIPLEALIERLRAGLADEERKRLQVQSLQPLKTVTGPVRAIEQAVHVLLRNAFDATPDGQPVRLEIRRIENRTTFTVVDNGTGMPQEVLKRAGRPFFTTKAPGKGMGLGLFLVRLVAERYGGKFELESHLGVGTRSTLVIPEAQLTPRPGAYDEGIHELAN